jgi:ribosomal protein S18 acetylase RimI-like enzyme
MFMMNSWQIREATAADASILVALIHAAFAEYRGRLNPPSGAHEETQESVARKLAAGFALLAFAGPNPAGCVFYDLEADFVYFSRLSVVPEFRRRGLGQLLIDEVEARARALNRRAVRLGVRMALENQRAYYQRLGYRTVEAKTHAGYMGPTYVIMEKRLGPQSNAF